FLLGDGSFIYAGLFIAYFSSHKEHNFATMKLYNGGIKTIKEAFICLRMKKENRILMKIRI
ncbi:MAG: hypothetical protein LIO75_02680, partial [Lachnospiraceae bacterium]|nr:hypothetical protein [Lachnospiraceae bacterium]